MNILITGSDGFVAKNLIFSLRERDKYKIFEFNRSHNVDDIKKYINDIDVVVHLAGENRPKDPKMFKKTNIGLSKEICKIIQETNKSIPIIFSSSTQATEQNLYGLSKHEAEKIFRNFSLNSDTTVIAYRFCGIFGKWSKPNYNSVISTFCFNIANDLPIKISDPDQSLKLSYIDDVVVAIIDKIDNIEKFDGFNILESEFIYEENLKDIADLIQSFKESRKNLLLKKVGTNFNRALYSTYLSYVRPENFSYKLKENKDERGVFVEMLKTVDSGQFSFFTAHPGITRGGHYHHSKNEKFLVLKGKAHFKFKNIITSQKYEILTSDALPEVVDSVPGWSHDITNIGDEDMIVMIWANELFNEKKPDTIPYKI